MPFIIIQPASSDPISERCLSGEDQYKVELINASGVIVNQTEIASGCGVCMDDQCPTTLCSTSLGYDENYSIDVTAFNSFGSSSPATFNEIIGLYKH